MHWLRNPGKPELSLALRIIGHFGTLSDDFDIFLRRTIQYFLKTSICSYFSSAVL